MWAFVNYAVICLAWRTVLVQDLHRSSAAHSLSQTFPLIRLHPPSVWGSCIQVAQASHVGQQLCAPHIVLRTCAEHRWQGLVLLPELSLHPHGDSELVNVVCCENWCHGKVDSSHSTGILESLQPTYGISQACFIQYQCRACQAMHVMLFQVRV